MADTEMIELRPQEKVTELKKIVLATTEILRHLGTEFHNDKVINWEVNTAISGIVFTVFHFLRRKANPRGQAAAEKYGDFEVEYAGNTKKIRDIAGSVTVNFDFKTAAPLVALLTSLPTAFNEVLLGVSKFKTRAGDKSLHNYGFNISHAPLLYGITFPPERRSAMAAGLGPLALAVTLSHETQFKDKLKETLKKSISHIPGHENIVNFIATGKPAGEVLKNLGDVLLLMSHKSKRRALFPLMLFVQEPQLLDSPLLTFTGLNPFKFYVHYLAHYKFLIRTMNAKHSSEVIFHSMFGLQYENLSMLESMTGAEFSTRSQIGASMKNKKEMTPVLVGLIDFKYIAKYVSANPTKFSAVAAPMVINGVDLSHFRKREYGQAFKSYMHSGNATVAVGEDAYSIGFALMKLKEALMKEVDERPDTVHGTTKLVKVNKTPNAIEFIEVDDVLQEGKKLFYS